jgi:glycosyltransferase involved in cell wall biosynthesis
MARHFHGRYRTTLFLPDRGPLFQEAESSGIEAVNLDFPRLRRYRGMDWFRWFRAARNTAGRLVREIRERGIELIHFNDIIDAPYFSAARKAGIPGVAHLRLILQNPAAKVIYQTLTKRSGVHVLPVSRAVRDQMLGTKTRIPHQVLYDPAPDPGLFYPLSEEYREERLQLRKQWGWEENDFITVMVSKLLPNKGHINFCQTAQELERISPGTFRFLMVAGSTPKRQGYENRVRAAFESLPEAGRRWIPGISHSDLPKVLRACDLVFHLPDTEDSFPAIVLEAMACGVPVVAHRVGGIPEQLDEGQCGLLVPRGDPFAAARAAEQIRSDNQERIQMVKRAKKRVAEKFSAEEHFACLDGLYKTLL